MDTQSGGPHAPAESGAAVAGVRAAAVVVKDARKSYTRGGTPVLNGLNMTVAEGSIYGLLGASGCGKTTLLTCIVGRRPLDNGAIRVLGFGPGAPGSGLPGPTVGYMPQELALHGMFTVAETFRYFGWISGMTTAEIRLRSERLLKLLDIPFPDKLVGELSGGQQRRVSLGVALLNKPPVLILDEPTVGVDPTLRQSIWDLLLNETRNARTTVIITTHYIEEARQSDAVGLMRNGTLLDEDAPEALLRRYGCASMEDVFLKLSVRQQRERHGTSDSHAIALVETTPQHATPRPQDEQADVQSRPVVVDDPSLLQTRPVVLAGHSNVAPCTWKMAVFTWRNKSVIGILFALPIIICVLFGFAVGGDPKSLHLAVVNDDFTCCERNLPAFPSDCEAEDPRGLSCRYLQRINKDMFDVDDYDDVDAAQRAVREGRAWGVIHFPSNYSHSLVARSREGRDVTATTLDSSDISVWLDMSNRQVSELARSALATAALQYFEDVQRGCKGNPNAKALPMQFNEPIYGKRDLYFPDFFAPAVILSVVYNINCIYTMSGFIDDRKDGFMERSISSGVRVTEILGAHVLVDAVMMLIVTGITLVFMCGFLGFENNGSLWILIFLCLIHGFCGMFQGYFISSLFTSDFEATFCCMGFYFPTLLLSGLMWPLEGMHPLLRNSVWLLPLNLATTAIRSIMNRGWGLGSPDVRNGFLSATFWLAFFVLVTLTTLRLKKSFAT
ncbi:ABC-transporter, subfamily H member 11 [Frankliniella occidentalis]|uniref:ABC transporter G family member 23 n=1 Tax=Frankliniella occidentalis TaxID=133901 RepID=A0A6J1RY53_FRAOC|nr:ABC transporter G family member 23 [Frankliniella occidentalis]KAE8736737.1 ABC-transporter, subfamily H member 11 [Frankliniella occidentalis]